MIQFTNDFLKKTNKLGFFVVLICGTLLHFTFGWSGRNPIVGIFSAINESTWEHMKLLFMPSFVYFLIEQKKYGQQSKDLLTARTFGLLLGLAFIPISFYTYSGIIGKSFLWVDMVIFAASIILSLYLSSLFLNARIRLTALAALLILVGVLIVFFLLTFFPPHIALFLDPEHFTYGI